jgi:hypothetical protein
MPLYFSDDKLVKTIPGKNGLLEFISKLDRRHPSSSTAFYSFIHERIAGKTSFSVASEFGGKNANWANTPLELIYFESGEDELLSAKILGVAVMEVLINHDQRDWICVKTNMQGREFESNFYFLRESDDAKLNA